MFLKFTTVYPFSWFFRLIGAILALFLILMLAFPIGFYGMAMYIEPSLPKMSELKAVPLEMPLQIYTKDGKLIGHYGKTYSLPITYDELPKKMEQAFLAAEDDSFFEHNGISTKGLGRAITQMISDSDQQTGGSTITQQVAKNYFLTPEQTFERKLTEMYLARRIESELSKNEIMTLYVNKIYLGQGAYGVRAGAIRYYNKELHELSIAQMAMLAGLPKAPSDFNPVVNPSRALERRNWILGRMLSQKFITQAEYTEAINSPNELNMYQEVLDDDIPYLAEMTRSALVDKYGNQAMNSGWRVQLTVNSTTQKLAEKALKKGLYDYHSRHGWAGVKYKVAEEGDIRNHLPFDGVVPAQITRLTKRGFSAITHSGEVIDIRGSTAGYEVGNIVHTRKDGDIYVLTRVPKVQGALVSINPENGALIAVVGGYNFYHNKFNRATQGYRQPGSTIKPLIYAAALETKKYTPDSVLADTPLRIGNWAPKNADGSFRGGMSMRQALAVSRNIPVIRAYLGTGQEKVHAMLSNFGLDKSHLPAGAAIALGAADATPLQMATAYTTFVNGGHRIEPYFIERIYSFENELVYQANPVQACALCFNSSLEKTNQKLAKDFENAKKQRLARLQALLSENEDTAENGEGETADSEDKNKEKATLALDDTNKENTDKNQSDDAQNTDTNADAETEPSIQVSLPLQKYRLNPSVAPQYTVAEQAPRILSPATAFNMAEMLRLVITSGTGKKAQAVGRPDIGGKTGTTNQAKDAWFAGVHPTASTIVWIGFDNPKSLGAKEYGGVAALPVWVDFMDSYLAGKPVQWVGAGNKSKSKTQTQEVIDITDEHPEGKPKDTKKAQPTKQNKKDQKAKEQTTTKPSESDQPKVEENYTLEFETEDGDIPEGDGEGQ